MDSQENQLSTSEKVCPYCKSANVVWLGTGRTVGVGQPMKNDDRFSFNCKECNRQFTYTGAMP